MKKLLILLLQLAVTVGIQMAATAIVVNQPPTLLTFIVLCAPPMLALYLFANITAQTLTIIREVNAENEAAIEAGDEELEHEWLAQQQNEEKSQ